MGKPIKDFNWRYYNQSLVEYEQIEREEFMRAMAEDAYRQWLEESYPDAKKYGFKSPITDHEKFMWIEGYMRGTR